MASKTPLSFGEKIARQREDRADTLERSAGHHAGSVWAINATADVAALRAAAGRARRGDTSPFSLA